MIPTSELRSALSAADPSHVLDAVVRRELAAGRAPGELFDELKAVWPEVATWPEYRGEAEADWHGMMDALRGWCHPACRYQPVANVPAPPMNGQPAAAPARV